MVGAGAEVVIEANERLRAWYGKPRKGTFDDKTVGVKEGEQRDKSGEGGNEESDEDTSPASTIDEEVDEEVDEERYISYFHRISQSKAGLTIRSAD
jgi:hypothetical protein